MNLQTAIKLPHVKITAEQLRARILERPDVRRVEMKRNGQVNILVERLSVAGKPKLEMLRYAGSLEAAAAKAIGVR